MEVRQDTQVIQKKFQVFGSIVLRNWEIFKEAIHCIDAGCMMQRLGSRVLCETKVIPKFKGTTEWWLGQLCYVEQSVGQLTTVALEDGGLQK